MEASEKRSGSTTAERRMFPVFRAIELPSNTPPDLLRQIEKHQFVYSILGLILGGVFVLAGVPLIVGGYGASTSFLMELLGSKIKMSDAVPGTILFGVGLGVMLVTRYGAKVGE